MVRLPVKRLKEGMIIAQSVYNNHGGSYLVKGNPLSTSYIDKLNKIGIPTVNVTSPDPNFKILPPDDIVQEHTRINAIKRFMIPLRQSRRAGG